MTALVDARQQDLRTVEHIVSTHAPPESRVFVFGSRARWTAKAFSDLDIAVDAGRKLSLAEMAALQSAFDDESLPWSVDVVDLRSVKEAFQRRILEEAVELAPWKPSDSAWRETRLGGLIELKRGYDLPQAQRESGPYPIVSSSGVSGRHIRAMVKGPGVVMGRYGTIGQVFYVDEDFWPLNTALYVRDFKGSDPRFIYYLLKTLDWTIFSDKSGVPGVNRNHVHEAIVRAPAPEEQRRVASVLQTLDDRIELNRWTNEALEAMAQAIFRDWFVDFGPVRRKLEGASDPVAVMGGLTPNRDRAAALAALFPDTFADDGLPEGWRFETFGSLFDVKIGKTPPRKEAYHFLEGSSVGVPWCSIRDLADCGPFISLTSESLRDQSCSDHRVVVAPELTVLLSFKLTVGRVAIADRAMATNEAIAHFHSKTKSPSPWFTYCHLKAFDYGRLGSTSSIATAVNSASVRSITAPIPSPPLLRAFDSVVAPLFARIRSGAREISTLAEARDYLLPRLMSGEVRVGGAEREVQAAA